MDKEVLYKPFKSTAKNKKMSVYVMKNDKKTLIHFGDSRYEDFTQHEDEKRRKSYLARAKGIKNKAGELTWKDRNSANYWTYADGRTYYAVAIRHIGALKQFNTSKYSLDDAVKWRNLQLRKRAQYVL